MVTSSGLVVDFESLQAEARQFGLFCLGASARNEYDQNQELHRERLSHWQQQGYAADMSYMLRSAELFTELSNFLPSCRSIVSFLIPYYHPEPGQEEIDERCPTGTGKIARYARGRDYHKVLPDLLHAFVKYLIERFTWHSSLEFRVFTDAVPLLERAIAADAALGFIGKNGMLIRAGFGSYGFLAEVLWNVAITGAPLQEVRGGCGSCQRCLKLCPTEAFVSERVLDARRCISYLTIEKRGPFSEWEREAIGDWLFGCDVCQEVCPYNAAPKAKPILDSFAASGGVGAFLPLSEVFSLRSDLDFRDTFRGTPLLRAKREGLLRNAAAVAANTGDTGSIEPMLEALKGEISPLVRGEFCASLRRLQARADSQQQRLIAAALQ